MGRILAGVLFLAGCVGDRPDVTPPMQGGGDTSGTPGSTTHLAPQVCGDHSWQAATGGEVELAAIGRGQAFQVLTVPLAGGPISAFTFDDNSGRLGVKPAIQLGRGMTTVSASPLGTATIATSQDGSNMYLTGLSADLTTAVPLATVAPGLVAKNALQAADFTNVLPVADDQGLRIETFDPLWNPTTTRVASTDPAIAMTAAPMQYATVAAWSTVSSCHAMTMYTAQTGPMATMPGACLAPALAIDPTTEQGVLVFEGDDGVRMIGWEHQSFVGVSQLLAVGGSSPHAMFDGHRMWISLLDADQHVVVGYIDADRYISTTLTTRPLAQAYDLVLMDGNVWAVSNVHDQFTVQQLCVEPTNG